MEILFILNISENDYNDSDSYKSLHGTELYSSITYGKLHK